jgi:DNA topoisomerase-1
MKLDPVAAECAGLTYVTDAIPGITRQRRRDGWHYRRPDGTEIIDPAERAWIDAIDIPPRGRRWCMSGRPR